MYTPRVLVTGAAGRIGQHVVAALAAAGHAVTGLDARAPLSPVAGVRYVTGRLEELTPTDAVFDDVDAVIHLGALMSWNDTEAAAMVDSNVTGTFRLLESVARRPLRRFVFASTGEVYPELTPVYLPIDEHHPRRPTSYYGMTKALGEELVRFYERKHGLPAVTLRFSHVQDPEELLDPESFFSGPRFFLSRRIARERAAGNERSAAALAAHTDGDKDALIAATREDGMPVRMGILAASDMATAVLLALESPRAVGQTLGVGPDEPVDLAELAREMGRRTGLRVAEITVPDTAANYWTLNARARELLGFRPALRYDDMVDRAVTAWAARSA
ncbi:NAD-dependent epimerase/dehydratase family protein [Actinoallomurus iriomotensis]|uniref:Nucleoside-diphosphate sugar epimerase n=1 Tax=Actinoallomurus iriomotensis TaxID=478107 RepID=A0A9W6RDT9_9ACTN|nr:NAD(P)-dependent oxidoreductase [Actinoallomurus iriomotensis]GLY73968.1 nucleoside-diphosphate sugar epimerase [Actinoallomurus iriomotensis]